MNYAVYITNEKALPVLATLILALLGWIVAEQRALRAEVGAVRSEVSSLREGMARLEGLFDQFTKGG